jgi:hypothetical protein
MRRRSIHISETHDGRYTLRMSGSHPDPATPTLPRVYPCWIPRVARMEFMMMHEILLAQAKLQHEEASS